MLYSRFASPVVVSVHVVSSPSSPFSVYAALMPAACQCRTSLGDSGNELQERRRRRRRSRGRRHRQRRQSNQPMHQYMDKLSRWTGWLLALVCRRCSCTSRLRDAMSLEGVAIHVARRTIRTHYRSSGVSPIIAGMEPWHSILLSSLHLYSYNQHI